MRRLLTRRSCWRRPAPPPAPRQRPTATRRQAKCDPTEGGRRWRVAEGGGSSRVDSLVAAPVAGQSSVSQSPTSAFGRSSCRRRSAESTRRDTRLGVGGATSVTGEENRHAQCGAAGGRTGRLVPTQCGHIVFPFLSRNKGSAQCTQAGPRRTRTHQEERTPPRERSRRGRTSSQLA